MADQLPHQSGRPLYDTVTGRPYGLGCCGVCGCVFAFKYDLCTDTATQLCPVAPDLVETIYISECVTCGDKPDGTEAPFDQDYPPQTPDQVYWNGACYVRSEAQPNGGRGYRLREPDGTCPDGLVCVPEGAVVLDENASVACTDCDGDPICDQPRVHFLVEFCDPSAPIARLTVPCAAVGQAQRQDLIDVINAMDCALTTYGSGEDIECVIFNGAPRAGDGLENPIADLALLGTIVDPSVKTCCQCPEYADECTDYKAISARTEQDFGDPDETETILGEEDCCCGTLDSFTASGTAASTSRNATSGSVFRIDSTYSTETIGTCFDPFTGTSTGLLVRFTSINTDTINGVPNPPIENVIERCITCADVVALGLATSFAIGSGSFAPFSPLHEKYTRFALSGCNSFANYGDSNNLPEQGPDDNQWSETASWSFSIADKCQGSCGNARSARLPAARGRRFPADGSEAFRALGISVETRRAV